MAAKKAAHAERIIVFMPNGDARYHMPGTAHPLWVKVDHAMALRLADKVPVVVLGNGLLASMFPGCSTKMPRCSCVPLVKEQ